MAVTEENIEVLGARVHNLKNIDVSIPREKLVVITGLSGMTYGPVAALLAEMFPPQIRYSSMSIPYHIGTGYFGGFLPFISQTIIARTGDPFSGLWYTMAVVAMALVVTAIWLPETAGKALD